MGTTAEKLTYLNDTKQLLKENINNLGGNLTNEPFRQYASVLEGIYESLPKISGIGSNLSLSPSLMGKIKLNEIQGDTYQKTNLYNNDIEQGAISEGTDVSANNRIRTKGYIEVIPNTQLYIGFSGCDDMYVSYYNSSKTFVSAYGWATGNANVSIPSNIYYIRVTFRKNDNSNITPNSISNLQIGNVPNPDYPQAIESVTGLQNVEVCGKNVYNTITYNDNFNQTTYKDFSNILEIKNNYSSISRTIETNTNYFKTTMTNTYDISQTWHFKNLLPNTQYTISCNVDINKSDGTVWLFESAKSTDTTSLTRNFTTNSSGEYSFTPMFYMQGTKTIGDYVELSNIQLEKGSTATTYEPYKGNTYEVNLGKNLIDLTNGTYSDNGITAVVENGKITLNGTASATSFVTIPLLSNISLGSVNKTLSLNNSQTISDTSTECRLYTSGQDYNSVNFSTINKSTTFSNDRVYTRLQIRTSSGVTFNNFVFKPQLEKGSTATSYSPYFTPIELNKIGDYEDRIYKENGTWYIEKNIGKVVLNGTESWETQWNGDNLHGWRTTIPNLKQTTSSSQSSYVISNNYETRTQDANFSTGNYGISNRFNQSQIIIKNNDILNQNDFITWLGTHNTQVNYILATPIYEVITNTELIEDLESLYNAKSEDGTTNINVTSEDLSMILNVGVLKGDA